MSMKTEESKAKRAHVTVSQGRRSFLKLAAVGAPAAVMATATGASAAAPQTLGADAAGYRKSDHVRKYLETARF